MGRVGLWAQIGAWLVGRVEDELIALVAKELRRRGVHGSSNVISTRVAGYVGSTRALTETDVNTLLHRCGLHSSSNVVSTRVAGYVGSTRHSADT